MDFFVKLLGIYGRKFNVSEAGRNHWMLNLAGTQCFMITLSYLLTRKLLLNFKLVSLQLEVSKLAINYLNLQKR